MALAPTIKPQYPNVPNAPGVPPVLREIGVVQANLVLLAADAEAIEQMYDTPQWGIFTLEGKPVLASWSTLDQAVNALTTGPVGAAASYLQGQISGGGLNSSTNVVPTSVDAAGNPNGSAGSATFSASVNSFEFTQDYRMTTAPQEQGAFLSYNKVQNPFTVHLRFVVSQSQAYRTAFLATVDMLTKSFNTYSVVTPDFTYKSVNFTHYDYRRTARSGVTMLTVDVMGEQVRMTGTVTYSNVATPSGANPVNVGAVQSIPSSQLPSSYPVPPVPPAGGGY